MDVIRSGYVVKKILAARIKADGEGLKYAPEIYSAISCFVSSSLIIPLACKTVGLFEIGILAYLGVYSIDHYHCVVLLCLLCYFLGLIDFFGK